jgi:3-hydroxyacyl-CoA dehydrogenase
MTFKPFQTAAVLGAGVMGSQIAAHLANAGLTVQLLDLPSQTAKKNDVVEAAFKKALKLSPPILFTEKTAHRITLGNFDEHWDRLAHVDWIIEAVAENLHIKQHLMQRLDGVIREDAVVSTNTSGLPIYAIAQGRSESFQRRFLGTHFFNPPRYLKLLEIIPTADTDPSVVERMQWFGQLHLGKGVVVAKDTPNFIANRIGMYTIMLAIHAWLEQGYTIEEIDTLTGPLVGRPKSATFRTADLVGLDTLTYVAENLYPAIPHDERREVFKVPDVLRKLVATGTLGAKTGQGFYKKQQGQILSLNPKTFAYEPPQPMNLGNLEAIEKLPLRDRLLALYQDTGRAGDFFRQTTLDILAYSAQRIPEIADDPADIDRAMRWGFGWELGPFEIQQILNTATPEIQNSKFKIQNSNLPSPSPPLWQNSEAALIDLGDGVVLFEFHSKGNTLSMKVMEGLSEVLDLLESRDDYKGMVIGNDSPNFSGGANLAEIGMLAQSGNFDGVSDLIIQFQSILQRVHYSPKPIVAAIQGRVLGGGCELVMACPQVVAAAETYIGLVELGVGLIPGAGGLMRMVARAAERAATEAPNHIQPFLKTAFETIAMAKVSNSAYEAQELGFLPCTSRIVMDGDRRLDVAKAEVLHLNRVGYCPPPEQTSIMVLGRPAKAMLDHEAYVFQQAGYASEYDRYLANQLAHVMTGGDLSAPTLVHENYLLQLERDAFLPLLHQPKTHERIAHMLKVKKPLRN